MKNKITRDHVARLAGVSHMTVSRVLNNRGYVAQKTKKKVLDAAAKLNYRRNIFASSLRSKKSYAIGFAVPTFKHGFYARLLNLLEKNCREEGYHIVAVQGMLKGGNVSFDWSGFEFLFARQIDGLIMDLMLPPSHLERLSSETIPIISIDNQSVNEKFFFVGSEDCLGMEQLCNYIIGMGHRKIAFLTGTKGSYTNNQRLKGYKTALKKNGIPYDPKLLANSEYMLNGGFQATCSLLDSGAEFTAIIGANDYAAIGAISALHKKGIKVPSEVSVAGFTGDEIGNYTTPTLTTMAQPVEEIGKKALGILMDLINKRKSSAPGKILLPTKLIVRDSVIERTR